MTEKVYLPHQLKMLFPSDMFKVMDVLFAFQKDGIVSYSKRNCEFLHMEQPIVEQCIQTACDKRIIEPVELAGGVYRFKINKTTIDSYREVALTDVSDGTLFKLSPEITFKNIGKQQSDQKRLSNEEILAQLSALRAQLAANLKGEENKGLDDLPW